MVKVEEDEINATFIAAAPTPSESTIGQVLLVVHSRAASTVRSAGALGG
jgi:hypothetical protein